MTISRFPVQSNTSSVLSRFFPSASRPPFSHSGCCGDTELVGSRYGSWPGLELMLLMHIHRHVWLALNQSEAFSACWTNWEKLTGGLSCCGWREMEIHDGETGKWAVRTAELHLVNHDGSSTTGVSRCEPTQPNHDLWARGAFLQDLRLPPIVWRHGWKVWPLLFYICINNSSRQQRLQLKAPPGSWGLINCPLGHRCWKSSFVRLSRNENVCEVEASLPRRWYVIWCLIGNKTTWGLIKEFYWNFSAKVDNFLRSEDGYIFADYPSSKRTSTFDFSKAETPGFWS